MARDGNAFRLPSRVRTTLKLSGSVFWDIKFYPWHTLEAAQEPIFAIVGASHLFICQIVEEDDDQREVNVLLTVKPESEAGPSSLDNINSCTWCYVQPEQPLVAIGGDSGQVNVVEALTGERRATLLGHSVGGVNDLAAHPIYPWIVASASMDASVRIWDLRRIGNPHETPCIIICGHGQAHKEGLLTVSWHSCGRYLVTGGHDQRICIWTIPDLSECSDFWPSIAKENRKRSSDEVRILHYPHFLSSAIHSNFVDKAVFLGDLILSKANNEGKIVLWQATGFNSRMTPPDLDTTPKTQEYLDTRNGFMRKRGAVAAGEPRTTIDERYQDQPPYTRILEFKSPKCESFYMRFGVAQPSSRYPNVHQTLVIGNTQSQIRLWDLERLIVGHAGHQIEPQTESTDSMRMPAKVKRGVGKIHRMSKDRLSNVALPGASRPNSPESSARSSSVATMSNSLFRDESTEATSLPSDVQTSIDGNTPTGPDRTRYPRANPFVPLMEHRKIVVSDFREHVTARAADWSPDGRWCVVVGEAPGAGFAAVMDRFG